MDIGPFSTKVQIQTRRLTPEWTCQGWVSDGMNTKLTMSGDYVFVLLKVLIRRIHWEEKFSFLVIGITRFGSLASDIWFIIGREINEIFDITKQK